jgi:hypothetical protein
MEIIIAIISVIFIIEGLHDYYVWKSSSEHKYVYTKMWHKVDFVYNVLIWSLVSYLIFYFSIDAFIFLFYMGISRMFLLNSTINLLRGNKISYLSDSSNIIDKTLKKYENIVFVILLISYISMSIYFISQF